MQSQQPPERPPDKSESLEGIIVKPKRVDMGVVVIRANGAVEAVELNGEPVIDQEALRTWLIKEQLAQKAPWDIEE